MFLDLKAFGPHQAFALVFGLTFLTGLSADRWAISIYYQPPTTTRPSIFPG